MAKFIVRRVLWMLLVLFVVSIITFVLMHAVHNAFIQSVLDVITVDTGNTAYFTTEFGLAMAIMGVIVAVIFTAISRSLDLGEKTTLA